jgi:hypothetical protein
MKHLILTAALALLPAAALAQDAPAAPAAGAPLPKCSAKVTDSCDQSATTEKNALTYYPADSRDAGNNKIGAAPKTHTTKTHSLRKSIVTRPTEPAVEEAPK